MISERAENEATIDREIVVFEKFAPAFERKIIRVHKFAVKAIAF